ENLEVVDISSDGKTVAKHEGMVVFIDGAVPGDIVDVMVYRRKNNFSEARSEKLIKPSEQRLTPVCKRFGCCGGCKWQNLSYEAQRKFKRKYVYAASTRIGILESPEMTPILGNKTEYLYRNKLELSFSIKKW